MYFDSSIPEGYGVGSSGALVAAVYDYYANDKITVLENLISNLILANNHERTSTPQPEKQLHTRSRS